MIFLSSPYWHSDKFIRISRYRAALRASAELMDRGELVFSPVAYGHAFEEKHRQEFPAEYWMRLCLATLPICHKLYVLTIDGWRVSNGVKKECVLAHQLSKPVVGYAHGVAEDISGIDILGEFGLAIPKFVRRVEHVQDDCRD